MVVEESYLQTAYDAVDELYGSVDGYLRDGLGLDDDAPRAAACPTGRLSGTLVR